MPGFSATVPAPVAPVIPTPIPAPMPAIPIANPAPIAAKYAPVLKAGFSSTVIVMWSRSVRLLLSVTLRVTLYVPILEYV